MTTRLKIGSASIAVLLAVLLVIWLASGEVSSQQSDREDVWQAPPEQALKVQVETLHAEPFQPEVVVQGQVAAWQQVDLKAQINGRVEQLPVSLGGQVEQGQTLLVIATEDRQAALQEAQARLRQASANLQAGKRLRDRQMISESEYQRLQSEAAAAEAGRDRARLALNHLRPVAPFAGQINRRMVELGDVVQPGDPLLQLVDTSRLKIQGQVPQQRAAALAKGQRLVAQLVDGREIAGEITFIASSAEPQTRSFRIEAVADNPDGLRLAGASATLRVQLAPVMASFVSPAYLNLDTAGRLAIKHVDADGKVVLSRVELLSAGTEGAWVTGLGESVQLITQGGGFVSPGQQVEAVPARRASNSNATTASTAGARDDA